MIAGLLVVVAVVVGFAVSPSVGWVLIVILLICAAAAMSERPSVVYSRDDQTDSRR